MMAGVLVIASPHHRNDDLEVALGRRLPGHRVIRLRRKEELTVTALEALQPSLVFFPHWSWVIPRDIYAQWECVIFHMTDVPFGRGGSPLQNLLVRGHSETQLTALRCVEQMDAGPVYLKRKLSLDGTAEEILRRASALMPDMIAEIVERRPTPVPQHGAIVEFKRRRPEDGNLALAADPAQVFDFIRMLDAEGYPAAYLEAGPWRLEFRDARLLGDTVDATVRITKNR